VSLEKAFAEGEDIRDLAVRPHERIALMRLLLAVAHAGLDGPLDEADWKACRKRVAPAAVKHLKQHRAAFELFGGSQRFGQLYGGTKHAARIKAKEPTWASKLELTLASGNNPTAFDNAGTDCRAFEEPQLALMLLTYQACSPLIGRGYKGRSPCVEGNMLHTFLRGTNLLETLWLNLPDRGTIEQTYGRDAWGRPAWLAMPKSPSDRPACCNAVGTYLGRLTPLPRAIWLDETRSVIALDNGLECPAWDGDPAEPTATVIVRNEKDRKVFPARLDRAIWRDLPSLAVKRRSDGSRAALAWQRLPEDHPCDFWVGALVTDGKAKVLNTVESVFALPAKAGGNDFIQFYSGGVAYAEQWARSLEKGLATYRRQLGDNIDRRKARKRARLMKQRAASHFWTAIEGAAREVLIPLCAELPDALKCGEPFFLDYSHRDSRWGPIVRRAADDAFTLACPQSSARQAAAFGAGRLAMLQNSPSVKTNVSQQEQEQPSTEPKDL
jgi:CRISPR system Cascade subunit CasA